MSPAFIISDDPLIAQLYMAQLAHLAIPASSLPDFSAALAEIAAQNPQIIFVALRPPFEDALNFIAASTQQFPNIPVICTYEKGNREVLSQALRCGARYCLEEPVKTKMMELALRATRILN